MADETFVPGLAGCRTFASKFANTCANQADQIAFADIPKVAYSCTGQWEEELSRESDGNNCAGTVSGDTCTWERQVCVTCYDDGGVTKIHVQTNGLPNHCYFSPLIAPAAVEVDFTANWMTTATQ